MGTATIETDIKPKENNWSGIKKTSSKLYHDDGNVIIIAENTAFKVHRSVLSSHSYIFKDMISQHSQSHECYDGCHVINIAHTSEELRSFLEVMYSYSNLSLASSLGAINAIFKLSNEYSVATLQTQALDIISNLLPTTLCDFDSLAKNIEQWELGIHFIQSVNDCNALWLLPAGLYLLNYFSSEEIAGLKLSSDLLLKFYRGLASMTTEVPQFVDSTLIQNKKTKECCPRIWKQILAKARSNLTNQNIVKAHVPLDYIADLTKRGPAVNLCQACSSSFKEAAHDYREDLWSRLPSIFGIGDSWDDLGEP
ncbi:hypothetical protein M422DRAFT_36140 [Sphaerobolus stellatus SS14]|uniref:BTB domain-containing protein n=1 Tax=Sphaerobolus stellatus (strain SS14) TaxID=990650 RepID=A0A0C9V2G1_SPHS4|nr:hypothetical protein M422DRAFT_36140 [Sphaerobolus stellatus SS14]